MNTSKEKNVPRLLLCLMFMLCASCAMNHGKPIAKLEYVSVERYQDKRIYQVSFTSNVDVVNLFKSKISQTLICSLDGDTDFSVAHRIHQYGEGFIETVQQGGEQVFKADLIFSEVKSSTNDAVMKSEALSSLLAEQASITCKVRINAYSYKTYFSEEMQVPTKDLLREIAKY